MTAPLRQARAEPGEPGHAKAYEGGMAGALNTALRDAMRHDSRVIVLGEDVGRMGGVFRVTDGLADGFGPARCFDTPLAEAGILGMAIGMAMNGLVPVAEMQFDAFSYPAFEQLFSHAAKMRNRTRGRMPLPLVVRMPYGGGVGAVEHHSDSSESYFAHTPGLLVVTPGTVSDAYMLLRESIAAEDPVVFLEPKRLYWHREQTVLPAPGGGIGRAVIRRPGTSATIITYGPSVPLALSAAERAQHEGFNLEVIDLRSLVPLDEETVCASVCRTGRAIVVAESPGFGGIAAELAATIQDRCFYHLEAPVKRVVGLDIPYPPPLLESYYLPDMTRILHAVRNLEWES